MSYNIFLSGVAENLLCEFKLGSDYTITSTSSFADTIPISTISGDSSITLSSNICDYCNNCFVFTKKFVQLFSNFFHNIP